MDYVVTCEKGIRYTEKSNLTALKIFKKDNKLNEIDIQKITNGKIGCLKRLIEDKRIVPISEKAKKFAATVLEKESQKNKAKK